MPTIGEIKYGHEIGRRNSMQFMWCACDLCKKERWVMMVNGKPENTKCVTCCKIGRKVGYHGHLDANGAKEGDIKTIKELGISGKHRNRYIYARCPNCNNLRWVQMGKQQQKRTKCRKCVNLGKNKERNGMWNGGVRMHGEYIMVKLYPNDPFFEMADCAGYVFEHRLVMAKELGRPLHSWEEVHHKDSIKNRNIPSNLFVTDAKNHNKLVEQVLVYQEKELKELRNNNMLLESENILLKSQILKKTLDKT